jgi:hypothetical protein
MTTKKKPKKTPMELVNGLFAVQHGLAADRQIRAAGVSADRQRRLIRSQAWVRYARGIVAAGGAAATWQKRAMGATLSASGAMLSGRSGARLHGADGFARHDEIEVMVHRRTHVRPIEGVTYRYSRHLSAADRHTIDGIPVTTLPVTLVHLQANNWAAEKALDGALRDGVSPIWLHEQFQRWQKLAPIPATHMLRALSDRVDTRLPLSWFQRLAKAVFDAEGIEFVDELPVLDTDGNRLAILDLADAALKVGVECQSWEWHGSPGAQLRDLDRKRRLRQLGWDIVDVWWSDLEKMDAVIADARFALDRARRLAAAESVSPIVAL